VKVLESVGFGRRYWQPDPERIRDGARVLAYCEQVAANVRAGRGLTILGPVGIGKSHALAYVAEEAYAHRQDGAVMQEEILSVRYVFGPVLFEALHRPQQHEEMLADLRDCDLLLLDDIDRLYRGSDWTPHQFETFMERRYAHLLATVITANTEFVTEADGRLERTIDRLRETNEVVIMRGESQRGKQGPAPGQERGDSDGD